jgi:hypothetical protein
MIINQIIWPMVIVGLSNANLYYQSSLSKLDYTTPCIDCQTQKQKNTIEYNYIKAKDVIETNNQKYQDLIK